MIELSFATDRGPREILEDTGQGLILTFQDVSRTELCVLVLFDGVGGANAGEEASAMGHCMVITELVSRLMCHRAENLTIQQVRGHLMAALHAANDAICQRQQTSSDRSGMATTAVCAVIIGDHAEIVWAGDSRAYLVRDDHAHRLTHDHSVVEELIEMGRIARSEAMLDPSAHVITQWLGRSDGFAPSARSVTLEAGDGVMLCSDGLTDVVCDRDIASIFTEHDSAAGRFQTIADRLIHEALARKTQDNTTVIAARLMPISVSDSSVPVTGITCVSGYEIAAASAMTRFAKEDAINEPQRSPTVQPSPNRRPSRLVQSAS